MQLEISNLSKVYGKVTTLRDISLTIPECKSLVLLGPSGSGKSTLLRIVAGLVIPDQGTIVLNGKPIPKEESELLAHRRLIGTVFQSWNLFPHLTALENICLPLTKVHNLSLAEAKDRAVELLTRFGLQDHASKHPAELSGGQSQRVAIVRAVAIRPSLLLFDEPTSALDPVMTAEVLDLIAELKEEGSDFMLVSHHLSFARKITDYVVFVEDGQVLEAGPTPAFFQAPRTEHARNFLAKVLKY